MLPYSIEVTTPPASEVVTTAELKAFCRLNTTDEDSLLSACITAAREAFEFHTDGRTILSTTYKQYFPAWDRLALHSATRYVSPLVYTLQLARAKVTAVSSVKYFDTDEVEQTLVGWSSDLTGTPAVVYYHPTGTLPHLSRTKPRPITVTFTAGWTQASDVPRSIRQAVLLLAAHYFETRSAYREVELRPIPMGFELLAKQYSTGLG